MASDSVSSIIIFIAAMMLAASVAGTLVTNVSEISASIDARSLDVASEIAADVEVISDPGSTAIYDAGNGTVTLLLKNTGSSTLAAESEHVDVLLDGQYVPPGATNLTVIGGSAWRQGEVVEMTLDRSVSPGEHRVVVIISEDREVFEFYR